MREKKGHVTEAEGSRVRKRGCYIAGYEGGCEPRHASSHQRPKGKKWILPTAIGGSMALSTPWFSPVMLILDSGLQNSKTINFLLF